MKALKHPLAVRDNDGNEYRVNSFHYDPDWKEELIMTQMPNGEFISWIIGQDCQWVEAEEQVKSCETCGNADFDDDDIDGVCGSCNSNYSNYTPKQ